MDLEQEVVDIQNIPSHILWKIFDHISISELKTFSLVCWQWYHEIAMAWRDRIKINLLKFIDKDENNKEFKTAIEKSKRYFENINLVFKGLEFYDFPVYRIIEIIELIKSHRSLTYPNSFKNVELAFLHEEPKAFVDLLSTFGDKVISMDLNFTLQERVEVREDNALKNIFANVQKLKLNYISKYHVYFCSWFKNLISLIMHLNNTNDFVNLEFLINKNPNLRDLEIHFSSRSTKELNIKWNHLTVLTSLKLYGSGKSLEMSQKYFANRKFESLRSFIANNCHFTARDFKAMQINWPNLEKLDLRMDHSSLIYNTPNTCLIYNYCWNMPHLKEFKIYSVDAESISDQDQIMKTCSPVQNESLRDVCYGSLPFIKSSFLRSVIKTTPNLTKITFDEAQFDFDVDTLLRPLATLQFLKILVIKDVQVKASVIFNKATRVHLKYLKEIDVQNLRCEELSRLFNTLTAVRLEKISLRSDFGLIDRKLLNFIPNQCPKVKIFIITSPILVPESCFPEIAEKYLHLEEFHYLLGGRRDYYKSISMNVMAARVINDMEAFFNNAKKLKTVDIVYNSRANMYCGPRCSNCHECMGFQLQRFCNRQTPPCDLEMQKFVLNKETFAKYTLRNNGRLFNLSIGPWNWPEF